MPEDIVFEKAAALARAIGDSAAYAKLAAAEGALRSDAAATATAAEFDEQSQKMHQLETENKPIEPEDKHRLEELRKKIQANPSFQALLRARVDYADLMRKVQEKMDEVLRPAPAAGSEKEEGS